MEKKLELQRYEHNRIKISNVMIEATDESAAIVKELDLNDNWVEEVEGVEKLTGVKKLTGVTTRFDPESERFPNWMEKLPALEISCLDGISYEGRVMFLDRNYTLTDRGILHLKTPAMKKKLSLRISLPRTYVYHLYDHVDRYIQRSYNNIIDVAISKVHTGPE